MLARGSHFAGYQIEALIGMGGMGRVYEATQVSLGRSVAIKVVTPEIADHESFRQRFLREQRLMASLDHPNILPLYEAGEADGQLFLAMRLVRGGTLADVIRRGDRDVVQLTRLIAQAASALDAAHEAGLVHRDVKPANMLLDSAEHLYLTDFGLAMRDADVALTHTGGFVGTINYIAPEQATGDVVTPAADIYALGCVLFEAVTGSVPYPRENDVAVLFAHVSLPPPRPTAVRPELSASFDAVVARAMAKEPAERYRSAGELARDALAAAGVPEAQMGGWAVSAQQAAVARRPTSRDPEPAGTVTDDIVEPPSPHPARRQPPSPRAWFAPWWRWRWRWRWRWPEMLSRDPDDRSLPLDNRTREDDATSSPPPRPSPSAVGSPSSGWREGDEPSKTKVSSVVHARVPPRGAKPPGFRLKPGFRYVHEPLADDRNSIPLLGNGELVAMLKERIIHSDGGAFLVTGFRGVGKTTVISRALAELRREDEGVAILPVRINVARPRSVEELLFDIIRRVFEALKDDDLLVRMAPRVQRELLLAYARTSLSFNESHSKATERTRGISVALPSLIEALTPKVEASRKMTDSLATQAAFLAYTDADVEHDFLRIVSLVERGEGVDVAPAKRGRRPQRTPPQAWQGKLVVVIDELDKLTADEEGVKCVSALLAGLKNLLTARGVHFLFVAGPDLHDVALRESRRGNSVYESVFSWQLYVPCLWDATDRLLDAVLCDDPARMERIRPLRDYLQFKSRGVPRLLLMELNSFVRWTDDGAYLEVTGSDRARLQFYADLERIVSMFVGEEPGGHPLALAIDQDRWKLGAYYVTDWILRSEGAPFTVEELIGAEEQLTLHPVFTLSRVKVRDFLEHLVKHDIIRLTPRHSPDRTYQGDVPGAQEDVFQLAPEYRVKLAGFARVNERERADLGGPGPGREPWADSHIGGEVGHGRYELLTELDRAGLNRVFQARDKQTLQDCAVKLFDRLGSPQYAVVRARFERAAEIARSLSHPNIVTTLDTFEENGRVGIVMALVPGTALSQLLARVKLTPHQAVTVAAHLADALEYIHEQGVARVDLKPSSILVTDALNPVILDLGLAKFMGGSVAPGPQVTGVGAIVGTPAYAAPEQLRGQPADIRSDIYALGLILYEMVAGRRARRGGFSAVVAQEEAEVDVDRLDISEVLRTTIITALASHPESRYPTPSALRAALAEAPESSGLT